MSAIQSDPVALVEAVERAGRLPAIPTHDWCEQAAHVVSGALLPEGKPGLVIVGVGRAGPGPLVDSTGVCVQSQRQGAELVRAECAGVASLPVASPTSEHPLQVHVGNAVAGLAQWRSSTLARWMTSRGMSAFLIGAGLLADAAPDRVMWFLGAAEEGTAYIGDTMFVMVLLLAILRRARLALGNVGSNEAEWISPREQEILGQLVLGKSVRQIAEESGRSPHTVHDHVKSLHKKLDATSRGELIARTLGHVPKSLRIRDGARNGRRA
ncbi:MAG: LuxR C-terminal-related transcriptional regulator [Phycisphaerales bacterium]|nr:hypothetical protein [Planctomycetota bacterium]